MPLSAMEEAFYKLFQLGGTFFNVFAQRGIVEVAQLFDDAINHCWRENAVLFVHLALAF